MAPYIKLFLIGVNQLRRCWRRAEVRHGRNSCCLLVRLLWCYLCSASRLLRRSDVHQTEFDRPLDRLFLVKLDLCIKVGIEIVVVTSQHSCGVAVLRETQVRHSPHRA